NGTTPVGGATVEIKRGNEVIAATTTDSNGNYSLDNIPDGEYNVVITDGDKVTTTVISITNGIVSNADVAMPAGAVSSGIEVVELPDNDHALTDTEGTLVGGLDKIAAAQTPAPGQHITIRLVVTPMKDVTEEDSHPNKESQDAIKELAKGKRLEYFDLQLTKTVAASGSNETTEDIGSGNAEMLRIVIPFNTARSRSITVYRYHGGAAEVMKENPSDGEEGYEVSKNCVIIHAKRFSPYAIGFTTIPLEPQHEVSAPKAENGTVAVNPQNAAKGSTVTVTALGDEGFEVNGMTVTDENGNKIEVKRNSDGTYSFVMPDGKVTIDVRFGPAAEFCTQNETCPLSAFADVNAGAWYHNGVHYCLAHSLMRGISSSHFAPNGITTRAQLITILWRMEGEPIAEAAAAFSDVHEGDWCFNAVAWASANGIAEGYGDSLWAPNEAVTRQQMAVILWRYAKYKGYDVSVGEDTNILSYEDTFDVAEYAIPAMQWACGSGIIQGMEKDGTMYLDPYGYASRSQSTAMIYRFCTEIKK
ncbi:MAG: S-layer homology domain-containing protein, partial [Oscillospiraceae bacterium]|nr:S-layer homology domain-containing protein [Oscillospiraceae bacterium]